MKSGTIPHCAICSRRQTPGLLVALAIAACAQPASDPRGPIATPGMTPRVVNGGVEGSGYRYVPAPVKPAWPGAWIWLDPCAVTSGAAAACFRKSVDLAAPPRSATARIAAEVFVKERPNLSLGKPGFTFDAEIAVL